MNIFVTGATGYIGSSVSAALLKAGHAVVGLIRPEKDPTLLERLGIRAFVGSLGDPIALAAEAKTVDATIHAAFEMSANGALADEAAVDAILNELAGTNKTFVYTSGVWVMGDTAAGADEDSPLNPPPVVAWRAAVERKVLDASRRGVRTVVIRPGMVYGRGGGVPAMFLKSARETGAAVYVGRGENHWTFVHVDDLADLYVRALGADPGSLFLAVDGPALRVRKVAEVASKAAGAEGRTREWVVDEAFPVFGPMVQGLILDQQLSGKRAQSMLGWKPEAPSVLDDLQHGSYAAG
jgi:nucleoside-diphosphate-sugar epimerase